MNKRKALWTALLGIFFVFGILNGLVSEISQGCIHQILSGALIALAFVLGQAYENAYLKTFEDFKP